jgi:hypothetical protein
MHNHVLEKAEEAESMYRESAERYRKKIKMKNN